MMMTFEGLANVNEQIVLNSQQKLFQRLSLRRGSSIMKDISGLCESRKSA